MKKIGFLFCILQSTLFAWTHVGSNLYGWSRDTLTFHFNPTGCTVSESVMRSTIQTALDAWNGISLSSLKVELSPDSSTTTYAELSAGTATDTPVIFCDTSFETTLSTPSSPVSGDSIPGVAIFTATDSSGHINYSGIILNAESGKLAEISRLTNAQLEVVLGHEMGHVLGLGHSSDQRALMYYSIGGKTKAIITQDDEDGVAHLYPRNEFGGKSFGCSSVHRKTTDQNVAWFFLGVLFLVLQPIWVRRIRSARLL